MEAPSSKRFCCSVCVHTVKSIPVIFILCILAWSYYAYVYHLCLSKSRRLNKNYNNNVPICTNYLVPRIINHNVLFFVPLVFIGRVTSVELSIPYLLVYHIILVLFLWSYFKTIFTKPSGAPPNVLTDNLSLYYVLVIVLLFINAQYCCFIIVQTARRSI